MSRPLPPFRRRQPPRLLPAAALALALLLTGCAGEDPGSSSSAPAAPAPESGVASETHEPSETAQPGEPGDASPTASTSTPTSTAEPGTAEPSSPVPGRALGRRIPADRRPALSSHLLAADRLPGTRAELEWRTEATGAEDGRTTGVCQKTDLAAIGAVESVRRTSTTDDGHRATQVVAAFADGRSTWRAREVLLSWRRDCAGRLDEPQPRVGPLRETAVAHGTAGHYRTAHGRPRTEDRTVTTFGVLRKGRRLVLVEVAAPAATYPGGTAPARTALRRVARTFS